MKTFAKQLVCLVLAAIMVIGILPVTAAAADTLTLIIDTNGGQPHDPIILPKNEYGYAEIKLDDITVYREGYSFIGWLSEEKGYWQQEEWTNYRIPVENYDGTVNVYDNNTFVAVWQDNSKPRPMLTVSPISAKPGETAVIEVYISNNDGIVFENASVWSWLLPEGYGESINITGHLKNNYSDTLKGDGKILELECDIPEDAAPGVYMGTVEFDNVVNGAFERYLFKDVPIKVVVEGEIEKPDEYEKYTVAFDANGGEGLPDSIEVTADKEWYGGKYCAEINLGDYKPVREGYTLIGWQKTDANGDDASSYWTEAVPSIYEDTIFTAIWEKNDGSYPKLTAKVSPIEKIGDTVTIDFYIENNDGVIIYDEYAFNGYDMSMGYENLVETNYSKELVGDGKIYSATFKLTAYNSSNHAEMLFSFADVVLGSGEKYMFTDISVPIDVEKNTYRVVFDANGGKGVPEPYDVEIEENDEGYKYAYITLPPVPTREGFTFIGWQEVEDNGNYRFVKNGFYPDKKYYYIDSDTEFVAIWQDNSIPAPVIKAEPITVKRGESVYVEFYIENNNWMTINDGSFLGFSFNTYYRDFSYRGYPDEDVNYSGSLIGDGKIYDWRIKITEDCFPGEYEYTVDFVDVMNGYGEPYMFLNVPVKITVDDEGAYVIKYDANGGTKEPYKQLKIEGEPLVLSKNVPEREGYTFLGWADSADADKPMYQPEESFGIDKNVTLYAVWKKTETRVPGDSNNDGEVDVFDLLVLRKHLAGISTEIDTSASDVNNDGEVDVFDLLMFRKYLAGMDVELK